MSEPSLAARLRLIAGTCRALDQLEHATLHEAARVAESHAKLREAAQYAVARVRAAAATDKPALWGVVNRLEDALT